MARLRLNTVLRAGVRTLLVAGFASGAWLLSSAAAHAAAPATVGRPQHSTRIRPQAVTALPTAPATGRPAVAGTHQVPYFPGRAPIPAYPDPASTGISTTASGSQHDAGAYAVVPAPVAAGHLADF